MDLILALGQIWRNWRRQENLINLSIASRVLFLKHIKFNTDHTKIKKREKIHLPQKEIKIKNFKINVLLNKKNKIEKFELDNHLPIGRSRIKLKLQQSTLLGLQERATSWGRVTEYTWCN